MRAINQLIAISEARRADALGQPVDGEVGEGDVRAECVGFVARLAGSMTGI